MNQFHELSTEILKFKNYDEFDIRTCLLAFAIRRKGYYLLEDEWRQGKLITLFHQEYGISFKLATLLYWGRWSTISNGKFKDKKYPTNKQMSKFLKWIGDNLEDVKSRVR